VGIKWESSGNDMDEKSEYLRKRDIEIAEQDKREEEEYEQRRLALLEYIRREGEREAAAAKKYAKSVERNAAREKERQEATRKQRAIWKIKREKKRNALIELAKKHARNERIHYNETKSRINECTESFIGSIDFAGEYRVDPRILRQIDAYSDDYGFTPVVSVSRFISNHLRNTRKRISDKPREGKR
jgi:hypothetical protein